MKNFTHSIRLLTLLTALFVTSASVMAQVATDLIISEYLEGSSNNKAIELYNGTGADIDLSNYSLKKEVNGAGGLVSEFPLSGTLQNGKAYVIANSSAVSDLKNLSDIQENSKVLNFNGNDAVGLFKNGTLIDVVGIVGSTPNWGADVTLRRKSTILSPNAAYITDEWDVAGKDDFTNIGKHTLTAVVGATISFATSGDFGDVETGKTVNKTITVKGENLTADLTVSISGNGFTSSKSVLSKSELESEAGCDLPVQFVASAVGAQEGVATFTGGGLKEPKTLTLSALVFEVQKHNSIAELLVNPKGETVYELSNDITVVYKNGQNYYIKDASGMVLLFDKANAILPASEIEAGHNIKGIRVQISEYSGAKQLVPVAMGTVPSVGNALPDAEIITVEELVAKPMDFVHKLVVVHDVTMETKAFTSDKPSNNLVTGADGVTTLTCRDNFMVLGGFTPPATKLSLTGFVSVYNNKAQIYPRSTQDIVTAVSNPALDAASVNVYAANGNVVVETESASRVEIFNTVGQAVKVVTVESGVSTISVAKGLYIIRVNGKATKVLVR